MTTMNHIIRNYADLALTGERRVVLAILEAGLAAIQPRTALAGSFTLAGERLTIRGRTVELTTFDRIFLIGFGKGAVSICRYIEDTLGERLTAGWVIDVGEASFRRLHYTRGTHPLPSAENLDFTREVLENIRGLTDRDLVLVVVCGGGSVLFEAPARASLAQLAALNDALLRSGATISEINTVRKHLSMVKGGGLAVALYPAAVEGLVFSDVPGNDLSVIASGPTVPDTTTREDARAVLARYGLTSQLDLSPADFIETSCEERYFARVRNTIMLSNLTALNAMEAKAAELGLPVFFYSDRLQGDAKEVGPMLLHLCPPGQVLLAGGETTVKVQGTGRGGRNQTLVLAALPFVAGGVIASVDSDGIDFFHFAGAIGDSLTVRRAEQQGLDPGRYLEEDNAYEFFSAVGDGIFTDRLESNVADLMVVYRK